MSDLPVKRPDGSPAKITRNTFTAFLGSTERSGPWDAADVIHARAWLGEVKLDFRHAEMPPDAIVEVHCDALMGNVELIVPADAEIRMDGVRCVVGEVRQRGKQPRVRKLVRRILTGEDPSDAEPEEPPLFVVSGWAVFGNIHVTTR